MEKTYEGFFKKFFKKDRKPTETTQEIYNKNKQIIRDCFVDLEDAGFNIQIYNTSPSLPINILIRKINVDGVYFRFNGSEIIETLLFAIPYLMGEFGLRVNRIEIIESDLINGQWNFGDKKIHTTFTEKLTKYIKSAENMLKFDLYLYSEFEKELSSKSDNEPF